MYYADFHIHSKYSRATSPQCTPEGLAQWAQLKGISVCATGDCTHPGWMAELKAKLKESPDADGLYQLTPEAQALADQEVPASCRAKVRFIITGEISSIYKRGGRVRKVHNIVVLPSLESAERLNEKLSQIGNIVSDGRPILGLDPRRLLEILLETDPKSALIPAHIWTPWFSMLGAKSGFDSVEECFGELTPHIFAIETGLSSDVPMNRRIRCLDSLTLISNSDLHSPSNLGRNANAFHGKPGYAAMMDALRTRDPKGWGGTIDLFPEEGKYHLDGHRACGVCMEPEESMAVNNLCPVCGKELTIGVLHRVVELEKSQKPEKKSRLTKEDHYRYIIPLPELIAQTLGVADSSKKVQAAYQKILAEQGNELAILLEKPEKELEKLGDVGACIRAVRAGRVLRKGGYDGEYGVIRAEV
jgi:DNA helicase II / ATP-dependent DNA helicase PcrA